MQQGLVIFGALLLGFFFRQGAEYVWVVRYILMWLLFQAFLRIRIDRHVFRRFHLFVVGLNVVLPLLLYMSVGKLFPEVGLALFAFTLAPTAAAAPIFAQFLRFNIATVAVSTLCTSLTMALATPWLVRWVSPAAGEIPVLDILWPVFTLIAVPLVAARLLNCISTPLTNRLATLGRFSIFLFAVNIWIAGGRAARYLFEGTATDWRAVAYIALGTGLVSIAQFRLGRHLGPPHLRGESSLSLGRKNNMFGLWVALTYLHPLAALGPIANIIWQNAYNSWELMRLPKAK